MKKTNRRLTLSTETVRSLSTEELARIDGGIGTRTIIDTLQGSCNGKSCDPSCQNLCVTLPH